MAKAKKSAPAKAAAPETQEEHVDNSAQSQPHRQTDPNLLPSGDPKPAWYDENSQTPGPQKTFAPDPGEGDE